jgi:nicotinamide riboside transporter PnuC
VLDFITSHIIDGSAIIASFTAIYLNAKKNILCWPIWIVSNILWIAYYIPIAEYSSVLFWVAYLGFNAYGLYSWSKDKKDEKTRKTISEIQEKVVDRMKELKDLNSENQFSDAEEEVIEEYVKRIKLARLKNLN